jgi:hypothetical protein
MFMSDLCEQLFEDGWATLPNAESHRLLLGCLQVAIRHEELVACLLMPIAAMLLGQCQYRSNIALVNGAAKLIL